MMRVASPLAVALALAGCGAGERPRPVSFGGAPSQWVSIATLNGSHDADRIIEVPHDALQWRTRWQCRSGELTLAVVTSPRGARQRVDEPCPSIGKAVWTGTGQQRLRVRASASWQVVIEAYSSRRSTAASR